MLQFLSPPQARRRLPPTTFTHSRRQLLHLSHLEVWPRNLQHTLSLCRQLPQGAGRPHFSRDPQPNTVICLISIPQCSPLCHKRDSFSGLFPCTQALQRFTRLNKRSQWTRETMQELVVFKKARSRHQARHKKHQVPLMEAPPRRRNSRRNSVRMFLFISCTSMSRPRHGRKPRLPC